MPDIAIRPLTPADLPAALAIQSQAYPAFLREEADAFASRLQTPAAYCLAAVRGDTLIAYLLANGWPRQAPPPVGMVVGRDHAIEVLYIHDLAVSPLGRGSGIGGRLVARAFALAAADGLHEAELIAVEGAVRYWRTLDFREAPPLPALATKVAGYGADARWMTRAIVAP